MHTRCHDIAAITSVVTVRFIAQSGQRQSRDLMTLSDDTSPQVQRTRGRGQIVSGPTTGFWEQDVPSYTTVRSDSRSNDIPRIHSSVWRASATSLKAQLRVGIK